MEEEFDRSLTDVSVVMLCGPAFSGKSAIYRKHFSATHERFSATELFSKKPECGLRYAAGCVVQLLRENKKVVIDDDNQSRQVREGYILQIQNKVADVQVACLVVKPRFGQSQIQWSAQTRLAESVLRGEDSSAICDRKRCNVSFEEPAPCEGFDKLSSVTTNLECSAPYKFEVPCLFIEFAGLFTEEGHPAPGIVEALRTWITSYPYGRLCVIQKGDASLSDDQVVALVDRLSTQIPLTPLYLLLSNRGTCPTDMDPLMADLMFLRRLHLCDFQHKGSLYCGTMTESGHVIKACALKCLKTNKLLKNPTVITSVAQHCNLALPDVLRHIEFTDEGGDLVPTIPFFSLVNPSSCVSQCSVDHYCRIFLIYSSYQSLERYNTLYASSCSKHNEPSKFIQTCAKPTTLPISRNANARKCLPAWMLSVTDRPQREENCKNSRDSNPESNQISSKSVPKSKQKTVKHSKSDAKYQGLPKNRIQTHKRHRVQRLEFVSSDSDSGSKFDDFNKTMHEMSTNTKQSEKDGREMHRGTTADSASDLSYDSDDDVQLMVCKSPVYARAGCEKKFSTKHKDLQTSTGVLESSFVPCSSKASSVLDDIFCEQVKKRPPPKKQRVIAADASSVLDLGKPVSAPASFSTGGGKKTSEVDRTYHSNNLLDFDNEDSDYCSGLGGAGEKALSPENEKKRRQALEALRALDAIF